jgi:hypothetical protein
MAKIKKGDLVQVISGKSQARGGDRGKQGKVIEVLSAGSKRPLSSTITSSADSSKGWSALARSRPWPSKSTQLCLRRRDKLFVCQ